MGKQQVIEMNNKPFTISHLQMLTYISNARLQKKKHKDKLLRQMHTYTVCSQNPITNDHIHKQCTVRKNTQTSYILRQMHTCIVCSQKPITNAHTHKQCTVKKTCRQAIETNKCSHKQISNAGPEKNTNYQGKCTPYVCSQKPILNAHIHQQCRARETQLTNTINKHLLLYDKNPIHELIYTRYAVDVSSYRLTPVNSILSLIPYGLYGRDNFY